MKKQFINLLNQFAIKIIRILLIPYESIKLATNIMLLTLSYLLMANPTTIIWPKFWLMLGGTILIQLMVIPLKPILTSPFPVERTSHHEQSHQ